jgi:hypothetical protein
MSLLTAVLTAAFGILVFVASQVITKLVIEPAAQVRKALASISTTILFRQSRITNATQDAELSEELRRAAAQLLADVWMVAAYDAVRWTRLWRLPTKKDALAACHQLNLLAYKTRPGATNPNEAPMAALSIDAALTELGRLLEITVRYEERKSDHLKGS